MERVARFLQIETDTVIGEKHSQFSIFNSPFFAGGHLITNHGSLQKMEN